ncbi:MAG TPA: (Fe-S)-binding protein [Flavisolibacter sp.]|nr:(Fe-S)-binding protein [Flavisolibacter sp.]
MKVGLFVPCYIDQFYPQVGIATLELLEKLGCTVGFPEGQTCCGQPMANAGFADMTKGCNENFISQFADYDYIVAPSGSCVLQVKEHVRDASRPRESEHIHDRTYELSAFLTDVLKVEDLKASFPHRVGLHISCHGQRMLHLASMSERNEPFFSKAECLLSKVKGLELVKPVRVDECCGFGGTFCVTEEAISAQMGKDRVMEHEANDVEYITGGDVSCLMHLEGILRRKNSKIRVKHFVEILNAQS